MIPKIIQHRVEVEKHGITEIPEFLKNIPHHFLDDPDYLRNFLIKYGLIDNLICNHKLKFLAFNS